MLRDRPDLVIAGTYTTPATRALLKKLHFPLLELGAVNSFDDVRRQTREVAAAVGARGRGEQLIAGMDATLRLLQTRQGPPLRVAAWDGGGFAAPPGSMYDTLLQAAGARNVAAEPGGLASGGGPSVERLLAVRPELLVEAEPGTEAPALRSAVLDNPTVRRLWGDRTVYLPARDYDAARRSPPPGPCGSARRCAPRPPARALCRRPCHEGGCCSSLDSAWPWPPSLSSRCWPARVWIEPRQAVAAVLSPHESLAQLIIVDVRLPRLLLGLLVGRHPGAVRRRAAGPVAQPPGRAGTARGVLGRLPGER